jgi:hypothetical protein
MYYRDICPLSSPMTAVVRMKIMMMMMMMMTRKMTTMKMRPWLPSA